MIHACASSGKLSLNGRRSQPKFLEALLQSLPHVSFAAREKSASVR